MSDPITTFLGESQRQKLANVNHQTKIAHVLASMTSSEVAELQGILQPPGKEKTAAFGDLFEDRDKSRLRALRQQLAQAESRKDVKPGAVASGMGITGALGGGLLGSMAGGSRASLGGAALGALLGGGTLGGLGYLIGKGAKGGEESHRAALRSELAMLRDDFDRIQRLRGSRKTDATEKYACLRKEAGALDSALRYGGRGLQQMLMMLRGTGGRATQLAAHKKVIGGAWNKGRGEAGAAGGGWLKKLLGGGKEVLKQSPGVGTGLALGGAGTAGLAGLGGLRALTKNRDQGEY